MDKLLNKWMRYILVLFLILMPPVLRAQEHIRFSNRLLTAKDTAVILDMIRKGNDIVFTHIDSALQLFTRAEQLSRIAGYNDGLGYALANKGLALTARGNFDQGFDCYKAALPYCLHATHLRYALIHLYFNMALSWSDKENYIQANAYYHKVLQLVQERMPGNYQFLLSVYNNMVGVQVNMGSDNLAMAYIDKAILLATKHHKTAFLAQTLMNKGDIYFTRTQYDSALYYYKTAAEYVKQVNEPQLTQSYYLRMGDVLLEQKANREALDYLQKAEQLSDPSRPLSDELRAGYSLGDALYRMGRYKEAEALLLKSIAKAEQTGFTKNKQNGHAVLMALYKDQGRYKKAYEQQSQYLQLSDSMINADKIRAVNEIEIKYQVAQKDKAIMENKLMIARQGKKLYQNKIIITSISTGVLLLLIFGIAVYRHRQKINLRDRKIEQLKAMMDGQEKERMRLSRELHDGLGGMLMGIKLNLKSVQRQHNDKAVHEDLAGIMQLLHDMGDEIRQASHNLMPDVLLKHHLKEALELYCEQLDTGGKLKIDLQFHGDLQQLDVSTELQVYRIIQELLHNIIRHAKATLAAIQVRCTDRTLCISVEDNGKGFDTAQPADGAGLHNIEARIQSLNGYFSIASAPGMGTTAYMEFHPEPEKTIRT